MNEWPDMLLYRDRGARESVFSPNSFPGVVHWNYHYDKMSAYEERGRSCDFPASPKTPGVRFSLAKVDEV